MARNVEIKARLENLSKQQSLAEQICGTAGELIEQEDIFFRCSSGRLKLRIFSTGRGQLISYARPDRTSPKTSNYFISETTEPAQLREVLDASLGLIGEVRKTRRLFLSGRTRIHLDSVADLGDFLELEVVLEDGDEIGDAEREAFELLARLEIERDWLVERSYVDLLLEREG